MCECWGEGREENETYTQHTHKYTHTHYINSPRSQLGIMKFVSAVTQKLLLWQWHLGISANIRNIQTTWQWQVSIWDFHKLMWQLLKFSQRAGPKCWGQHQMPVTANDQSSQCWESRGRAPDTMISNFFFLFPDKTSWFCAQVVLCVRKQNSFAWQDILTIQLWRN